MKNYNKMDAYYLSMYFRNCNEQNTKRHKFQSWIKKVESTSP